LTDFANFLSLLEENSILLSDNHWVSTTAFCGFEIMKGYNCFDIFKKKPTPEDLENYPLHLEGSSACMT
jgi:hypothetical protein